MVARVRRPTDQAQARRARRLAGPLLLALLLAACSLNGEAGVQPTASTGAVAADAQDLMPAPEATATAVPTSTPSRTRLSGRQTTPDGVPAAPSVVGRVI